MLCGHGSRAQSAVDEFATLAAKLPPLLPPGWRTEYGYLEFANPLIRDGLDRLRGAGCDRILAVPGMLFAAMHAKNDIPTVLSTYAAKHGIEVSYGRELGVDPKMIAAAGDRIAAAMAEADARHGPVHRHDTLLVVIGRGASDPDANGNVAKVARMLHEGLGTGWLEVGYSGVTFPLVEPCLTHAARLGYARIVVFPYFLFSGILVDRIRGFTERVAAAHPGTQFVSAGYLGDHPQVLATFAERATEQLDGVPPPNCQMCKYRTTVLGFEAEVGAVQESHHHHVEGQGASAPGSNVADCALCDDFCTGLCRLEAQDAAGQGGGHAHAHAAGRSHGAAHDDAFAHADGHSHAHAHAHAHAYAETHAHPHGHHDHDQEERSRPAPDGRVQDRSVSHARSHAASDAHGHAETHSHSHSHTHSHSHAPYPHADHPHGPESARKTRR